ncbi:hypothetical protein ACFPMF_11200 [Larkinella bovis]|uniref:Uncharacterized protein n=1 Tax=Larkinella bovis TaxID=683041 RepID=A0ABW0IBR5_9BACT
MKERIPAKSKRLVKQIVPGVILLTIAYLIYKSLNHCHEIICECRLEESTIWDYLIVQGALLVIYVAMRIIGRLREKAVHFTKEIRFFSYAFSLLPLTIRLWVNFSEELVQKTLVELLPVLGIELLLVLLLEIYDEFPPDKGHGAKPRPRQTPTF